MPDPATPDPAQRVVVTGAGMITSLGADLASPFDAMQAGRSGVRDITRFDATGLPCTIAGELDVDELAPPAPLDDVGVRICSWLVRCGRTGRWLRLADWDIAAAGDKRSDCWRCVRYIQIIDYGTRLPWRMSYWSSGMRRK